MTARLIPWTKAHEAAFDSVRRDVAVDLAARLRTGAATQSLVLEIEDGDYSIRHAALYIEGKDARAACAAVARRAARRRRIARSDLGWRQRCRATHRDRPDRQRTPRAQWHSPPKELQTRSTEDDRMIYDQKHTYQALMPNPDPAAAEITTRGLQRLRGFMSSASETDYINLRDKLTRMTGTATPVRLPTQFAARANQLVDLLNLSTDYRPAALGFAYELGAGPEPAKRAPPGKTLV